MTTAPETPARLEPMRLGDSSTAAIGDVLAELSFKAGRLDNAIRGPLQAEAANLVRIMNCYYSNLIEGHATRPRDIAAAVEGDLSDDPARRDLQLEARAHVIVQQDIDRRFHHGELADPADPGMVRWLHRDFYAAVPDIFREINVYLLKRCREHGVQKTLISDDIGYWKSQQDWLKPGDRPLNVQTRTDHGCPYDCGLCPDHEQHSCLAILEINEACNLSCPVCSALNRHLSGKTMNGVTRSANAPSGCRAVCPGPG